MLLHRKSIYCIYPDILVVGVACVVLETSFIFFLHCVAKSNWYKKVQTKKKLKKFSSESLGKTIFRWGICYSRTECGFELYWFSWCQTWCYKGEAYQICQGNPSEGNAPSCWCQWFLWNQESLLPGVSQFFSLANLIHFVSRFAYISCLICREKNQVKNQIWNKEFSKFT